VLKCSGGGIEAVQSGVGADPKRAVTIREQGEKRIVAQTGSLGRSKRIGIAPHASLAPLLRSRARASEA
jgi:hypothetical protein